MDPFSNNGGVTKEGNLLKAGKVWPHKWHKRYFVLRGNEFLYYKSSKDTVPQGRILLHAAQCTLGAKDTHFSVEVAQDAKQQGADFSTVTAASASSNSQQQQHTITWKLKAASKSDRQLWLDAIEKAIIVAKFNIDNKGNSLLNSVESLTTSAAAAPFIDSDSQYKSVQESYLRRLSVNLEALSSQNPYGQQANTIVAKPTPEKKAPESAFKRLSRIFFHTKEEKPKETVQAPSLVELYFREQDQIEEVRRKSLSQSGGSNANITIGNGDISDFNELQKLIHQADVRKSEQQQQAAKANDNKNNNNNNNSNNNNNQQQNNTNNNNNNYDNDTSSLADNTLSTNVPAKNLMDKRRVDSIDNDATENDFNSDDDDSTTPTSSMAPNNNKARRYSRLKNSHALKQYKEDKQHQQQQQQAVVAAAVESAKQHKRTNSDESENNSSSVSEGETKSDAEISIAISHDALSATNSSNNAGKQKRNTIYYQPNVLHDPLQEIKHQKQQKQEHENSDASHGGHHQPAAQPQEKKERRKSLLFNLFARKQ